MPRRVDPLSRFSPLTREWFTGTFVEPTPAQAQAWNAVADGDNTLVIAPTGSGKTLAAFLWAIDELAREPEGTRARHPGPLHLAAEGAGRRRGTQPAHTADRHRAHRRTHRATTPGNQRRCALRRHAAQSPPRTDHQAARHPDHHPRVAVPDADVGCPRDAGRRADGHRRRGARRGGHQARRAPGGVPGTSRRAAGDARPADRPVGDGAPGRGGGALPVRCFYGFQTHGDRRPAGGQDVRSDRAGAGAGHGESGEQLHLARRRGTHRRPDRGAQLVDRVRQLPTPRRATDRPAQRNSRRTHRDRAGWAEPRRGRWRTRARHGQRADVRRRAGAGPRPSRLGQQGIPRRSRGSTEERAPEGRRRHLQPGTRNRHGRSRSGDPGGDTAVGGQRPAAHRPGRPPGRRDQPGRAVPQAPHRPDRLRCQRAADAGRSDRDDAGARQSARRAGPAHRRRVRAGTDQRRPVVRHRAAQRTVRDAAAQRVSRRRWTCCRASTRRPSSPSCAPASSTTAIPAR